MKKKDLKKWLDVKWCTRKGRPTRYGFVICRNSFTPDVFVGERGYVRIIENNKIVLVKYRYLKKINWFEKIIYKIKKMFK